MKLILLILIGLFINCFAEEHNPMTFEYYDDLVNPTLKLSSTSMGGDAMKSFIVYIAIQNLPGAKESGVGYYYDNQKKKMKRVLFYRLSQGYPRETRNPLDFFLKEKGSLLLNCRVAGQHILKMDDLNLMMMGAWLHLMIISQYLVKMVIYIFKIVVLM